MANQDDALALLGGGQVQEPAPKKRGRPRKHESNAAKQAAYRANKGTETVTLEIPKAVMDQLREWNRYKHLTYQEIFVDKLLVGQLLRKR